MAAEEDGLVRRFYAVVGIAIVVIAVVAGAYSFFHGKAGWTSGAGTVTINGTTYQVSGSARYLQGQMVGNFQIQSINPSNVTGVSYIMYPLARAEGVPRTLQVGDMVGYACDGTLQVLASISQGYAVFDSIATQSGPGSCPI